MVKDPWLWVVVAWAAIYAFVALWSARNGSGFPPDAIDYAEVARSLVRGDGFTINRVVYHTGFFPKIRHVLELHAVLQPALIAVLFAIGGTAPVLARVPSVLFAASMGVLVFWIGRRFFGTLAGLIGAALVLTHSYLIFMAMLATDDAGFALFSLAALSCFVVGVDSGKQAWFVAAGVVSALAALQKYTGIVLPAVFTAVVIVHRGLRRQVGLKNWLCSIAPVAPVPVLYTIRNYYASGTFGSSYGGLEWLGKGNLSAFFAYYPSPPTTSEAWAQLGRDHVLELIRNQFALLALVFRGDLMLVIGTVALLWLTRKNIALALFGIFYSLAVIFLITVVHHVEQRYLSGLIPLHALAIGAAVAAGVSYVAQRVPRAELVVTRAAAVVVAGFVLFYSQSAFANMQALAQSLEQETCPDTVRYLRQAIDKNTPVLTSNTYFVSWFADRPAVVAPTSGPESIVKVVRDYKLRWAVTGALVVGTVRLEEALQTPELREQLRPELAFKGSFCDVYKLNWAAD